MSSAEPELSAKERKKSAHWSDTDTAILINLLLQHKNGGRTQDNGFKPEVWRMASDALSGVSHEGGPKTPDACKSRWQRLQRDYKAAKDMEILAGFRWNKDAGKLQASPEAWEAADKLSMDAYKHQKIHLPLYDSIAVLCPLEGAARKGRGKARPSLASPASDMSQQHQQQQQQQVQQVHHQQQQHQQQHHRQQQQHQQHQQHKQPENLAAAFETVTNNHRPPDHHWAGLEASMDYDEGPYHSDEQYGLFRQAKRHHMMDPNLMASATSSPTNKRARHSPILGQAQNQAHAMSKFTNGLQQIPQGMRTPNGSHFIHQPQPQIPHLTQIAPQLNQAGPSHQPQQQPSMLHLAPRSPDFPNPALLDTSLPSPLLSSDVQSAGLSEPQRRSAAILMLQDRESDMADVDLVDIVTEFELNVTSADTYLALSKPGVRKIWLQRLLHRVATHGHDQQNHQQAALNSNGFGMSQTPGEWNGRGQAL